MQLMTETFFFLDQQAAAVTRMNSIQSEGFSLLGHSRYREAVFKLNNYAYLT